MRGIPKVFGTEQDVINSLAEDPAATKAKLRELLAGRMAWFPVQRLDNGALGLTDATHKVIEQGGDEGQATELWQYALQEDANAHLFKIGLTVEKVNQYLL